MKDQADKELWNAAQAGDLKAVETALAKGADIETNKVSSNYTPLSIACNNGKVEVAKYLLSKGAKVNADCSHTPLFFAASSGNMELVELLIGKGADIEKVIGGYTPLSIACHRGKVEVAKYLLSKGAKVNVDCSNSPLYGAAYSGSKELVELLVGKGADIEKVSDGYTPLSIACQNGKFEVAKYLLSKGAKANVGGDNSLLYYAAREGDKELVELLVAKGADIEKGNSSYTPLSIACHCNNTKVAKYLLSKGAKANVGGDNSPLYYAAYNGNKELVELLVDKGADIEKGDSSNTPLSIACQNGKFEVAKYLLSKGAKANVGGDNSLLYYAAREGDKELAELLVDKGADIEKGNSSNTPLSIACHCNNTKVAKYLLSKGAKANVGGNNSLLYYAAYKGNKELVELLVDKGADIEKGDSSNTPLSIACQKGKFEIAKYLLSKGAKANVGGGNLPLYWATYYGRMELVEMLLAAGSDTKLKVYGSRTVLEYMEASGSCDAKLKPLIRQLFALADKVDGALVSGYKEQVKAVMGAATSPMVIKRLYAQQAQNALGAKVDLEQCKLELAPSLSDVQLLNIWPELLAEKDSKLRAEVIEQFKKSDYQPLSHVAASAGSMGIIQELLGGANSNNSYRELNKLDKAGHSLLHIACESENLELAKYLISRGAKLSAISEAGLPELALVLDKGYLGIEELLKKTILVDQALLGNSSEAIEQIVKDKSLIELLCQRFSILDKFAAGQIKLDLVKHKGILVQYLGKAELLELWPKLAKMNEAERQEELVVGAEKGDIEQIKLLVAIGVSPHILGDDERLMLYIGANKNYVELVKYCLSKEVGANVEIGRKKVTPLHMASSRGNIEIVKLLLAAGADTTKQDEQGRSAAKLASNNGHKEIVKLLESASAAVVSTAVKVESVAAKAKAESAPQPVTELELQPKSKPVLATKLIQKVEASSSELEAAAQASKLISEGSDKITGGQKQGILLLGNTGAGKSSLTYYLAGKQLVAELDDETGELLVKAKEQVSDIVIGHRARSETKVPNKLLLRAASEAIDGDGAVKEMVGVKGGVGGEGELAIWDCPGFKDTSVAQAVANGFYIKKLHQQHRELKFVLVATEGSIYGSRGIEFVEVLEQFCRSFQRVEHVQDSVYLVVSRAGAGRQSKHIAAKLSQIRAENPSLSEAAKQMLDYLVSDKSDKASTSSKSDKSSKSKIGLFYAPNKVGAMLLDTKLLASIESDSGYVDTAKETGRIAVSEESKKICSILMQQSYNNLHEIMDILQQAVIEPSKLMQGAGEGNVFVKHLDKIEELLPKKLYDQRTKELAMHSKGEYGIEIELLQKLKRQCTEVVEYGKGSKVSKVSKGSKGNKDSSKYSSVEEIVARALGILEILEEYALAGKDGAVELREVIYKYSHALKHQLGYCQILGEIAGLEQLLTVEGLSSYMQSIKGHIELAYHLQLSNMELATEQSELEVEGVSDAAGDASKDPANDPTYYKQMLSYLTNYQLEQQAAKKTVPAKCISNISKCYAELGKLSISKGVSDYQQAIEYYAKSLEYVEDYTVYDQLGDLLASLGQWQLAAKCYVVSENHLGIKECGKQLIGEMNKASKSGKVSQVSKAEISQLYQELADDWSAVGQFAKAQKYYNYAKSKAVGTAAIEKLDQQIIACLEDDTQATWKANYKVRKAESELIARYNYKLLPPFELKQQLAANKEQIESAAAILAKSSLGLSESGYELLSEELTSSEEVLNGSSGKTELLLAVKEEHLLKASIYELIPYETELGSESWLGAITTMGAMAEL